ncbi:MAG: hypothetical protein COB17_09715 [Sulfurimonas sp.]|nr:MAG: hypothetical protein COB17_09715 [Sulfurimonas sp.]
MCIPHGGTGSKDMGYIDIKPKKHIKRVSLHEFEKGDPHFVDERVIDKKTKFKKSLFRLFFGA